MDWEQKKSKKVFLFLFLGRTTKKIFCGFPKKSFVEFRIRSAGHLVTLEVNKYIERDTDRQIGNIMSRHHKRKMLD